MKNLVCRRTLIRCLYIVNENENIYISVTSFTYIFFFKVHNIIM